MTEFTHLDSTGAAHMVDVAGKHDTLREAVATAFIGLNDAVIEAIFDHSLGKGDVLATARIAAIQAAKKCADLIPLCHPLPLSHVSVEIERAEFAGKVGLRLITRCRTTGKTGVEMEALTAASVGALTVYDMCKALDKGFEISDVRLLSKSGGKSGDWRASEAESI